MQQYTTEFFDSLESAMRDDDIDIGTINVVNSLRGIVDKVIVENPDISLVHRINGSYVSIVLIIPLYTEIRLWSSGDIQAVTSYSDNIRVKLSRGNNVEISLTISYQK